VSDIATRIRVSRDGREIEVQGSEEFVLKYFDKLRMAELLGIEEEPAEAEEPEVVVAESDPEPTFAEHLTGHGENLSISDQFLVAGDYLRVIRGQKTFTGKDCAELLDTVGVVLKRTSNRTNDLHKKRKQIVRAGKGRYKLNDKGLERVAELRG
jgi:hypothetical protein